MSGQRSEDFCEAIIVHARRYPPRNPPAVCLFPYLAASCLPSVRAVTLSKSPLSTAMSKLPDENPAASRASENTNRQPGYSSRILSITPWGGEKKRKTAVGGGGAMERG